MQIFSILNADETGLVVDPQPAADEEGRLSSIRLRVKKNGSIRVFIETLLNDSEAQVQQSLKGHVQLQHRASKTVNVKNDKM